MFSWFTRLMEYLGLVSKTLDEASASLDKVAEPVEKVREIEAKAEKVGDQYRDLVR